MTAVSFLNVGVTGLLLATFTTRFIYPLVSLEGRRFWILGTLPLKRSAVLWSKFFFAAGMSLIPCSALILLSDVMLGLHITSPLIALCHQITCAALCLGLSGIAVGLGARFPNLREASAAKIAAGFGGTLTLVISVIYIAVVVLLTAVPTISVVRRRLDVTLHVRDLATGWPSVSMGEPSGIAIGILATILLGMAATLLPLSSGSRAFHELEH
jgi:ABC-2 type transport system permease protein